ncbi:MAG: hypothetical protein FJX62_09645 [Alphaproteobacteria bacterium]|nr:hypothetical protein [Alphaproteobacteria bacterium]
MLNEALAAVEALPFVAALRNARWGYALVNAGHIAGIALLFGAIVPLDLRLIGLWRSISIAALARVLVPVAVAGLMLAVVMGALLFAIRAREYAAMTLFQIKLLLVLSGIANALLLRRAVAWERGRVDTGAMPPPRLRMAGALSIAIWLSAMLCGRFVAFAD